MACRSAAAAAAVVEAWPCGWRPPLATSSIIHDQRRRRRSVAGRRRAPPATHRLNWRCIAMQRRANCPPPSALHCDVSICRRYWHDDHPSTPVRSSPVASTIQLTSCSASFLTLCCVIAAPLTLDRRVITPQERSIVMSSSVCLSVCLSASISQKLRNHAFRLH